MCRNIDAVHFELPSERGDRAAIRSSSCASERLHEASTLNEAAFALAVDRLLFGPHRAPIAVTNALPASGTRAVSPRAAAARIGTRPALGGAGGRAAQALPWAWL